jgi:hypothetical protein
VFIPMPTIWTSASWRDEADAWIRDSVAAAGHELLGPIEQVRVRLWSTQLTVRTTAGLLWFKENHPGQSAEAAVIDELARIAPDHVVVPVAVERERGWLLTPDHGETLATLAATDEGMWCRVVAEFAEMQRRTTAHRDDLLAAGLAPLLPAAAADQLEEQIERLRSLPPSDAAYVGTELAERVLRALPAIRATAERLAAASPPLEALEHNDLHQNNVFIPREDETTLRFFDFGDAVWAHPFTTLAVPLEVLCREWATQPDDPRVGRVVDSYLEVWSDQGTTLEELREAATLARRLHPVHRYESWRRLLEGSPRDELPEVAGTMEYWLARIADTPTM